MNSPISSSQIFQSETYFEGVFFFEKLNSIFETVKKKKTLFFVYASHQAILWFCLIE